MHGVYAKSPGMVGIVSRSSFAGALSLEELHAEMPIKHVNSIATDHVFGFEYPDLWHMNAYSHFFLSPNSK